MKHLFLALLVALCLSPGKAKATGIEAAIGAFLATSGAGATFGAALSAGFQVLSSTFVGKLLVGAALSLAGQLLQKKPKSVQPGIQTQQTTTGDVTPQKFIVGTYAVEGHAVAPAYSRGPDNRILTYILEVSNIPIEGLTGRVIIDGQYATIEAADAGNRDRQVLTEFRQSDNDPTAWMWFYDGTQTAAATTLVSDYGSHTDRPWGSTFIGEGTAYAILEFFLDREFFSGLPSVRFEAKGIKLYDPRKDTTVGGSGTHRWNDPTTWEWTDNPQVINYNILRGITLETGDIYGGEVPAEDLPLDNWFAAMNECDVLIGSRKQFTAGFEINTGEMEPFEVIQEMNRASFAQMSEFGGVFRVRVGAPATAVLSVSDDDFVTTEPSQYIPFPGLAETHNAITGSYVEPVDVWQSRSADAITKPDWETEDGNRRLTLNIDLPAVSNKSQAQHLLNAYLEDNRRFRVHRMGLPPSFAEIEPLDVISFTSEINGYTAKDFEVIEVESRSDTLLQIVTVREREAGDVAWTSGDDVPAPTATNDLTLPDGFVDILQDADTVWNGRFAFALRGWTSELISPTTLSVIARDSASGHDAVQTAPTAKITEWDFGSAVVSGDTRLIWGGLVPVQPGAEVHMSFRAAAGTAGVTYANNGGVYRGVLRWYDEDGVQLAAPDDESDDWQDVAVGPTVDVGWWKTWQRSGLPPKEAAFAKPVIEISDGQGLFYLTDIIVNNSFDTARLSQGSITDAASTSFSTTTLAADNTPETIGTATVTVPELASGTAGESLGIDAQCYVNVNFSGAAVLIVRLRVAGVVVASGRTESDGVVTLTSDVLKTAGDYDVTIQAEATDVSALTITEGRVKARVYKR